MPRMTFFPPFLLKLCDFLCDTPAYGNVAHPACICRMHDLSFSPFRNRRGGGMRKCEPWVHDTSMLLRCVHARMPGIRVGERTGISMWPKFMRMWLCVCVCVWKVPSFLPSQGIAKTEEENICMQMDPINSISHIMFYHHIERKKMKGR